MKGMKKVDNSNVDFDEFVKDKENEAKVIQYVAWLNYQMGFSGVGTTALDQKPDFDMPELPENIKQTLIEQGKEIAKFRWECWCKARFEVTGEESGAWHCPELG
jgi:hypothetical protein